MEAKPHTRDLRRGRFSSPGQIYLVTATTRERYPFFTDLGGARTVVRALREHEALGLAHSLCFVVMPDHLHWLMQLGTVDDLSRAVQRVKSMVSRRMGQAVWQRGFHDRAIRKEEDIQSVARYVVANPLRAGLAKRVGEYSHWDAIWL